MRTKASLTVLYVVFSVVFCWLTLSMFGQSEWLKMLLAVTLFVPPFIVTARLVAQIVLPAVPIMFVDPPRGMSLEEYRALRARSAAEWKTQDEQMTAHRAARLARIRTKKQRRKAEE